MGNRLFALAVLITAPVLLAAQQKPPAFTLALVDRAGVVKTVGQLPPGAFAPRIAPDGKTIAFDTFDGTVWIADINNLAAPRRFASGRFPMWSPDGGRLLFTGVEGRRLFSQPSDGSGSPELLTETARAAESWSTQANLISFITLTGETDYDVWAFSPHDRQMRPLISAPSSAEMSSRFSPDGRWLAYSANDSGTHEIYVEAFPRTGARTRVSTTGGQRPVWSPDGREIYFDQEGTLYAVSFHAGSPAAAGKPSALPVKGFVQGAGRRTWDLMPDGKEFLVMLPK